MNSRSAELSQKTYGIGAADPAIVFLTDSCSVEAGERFGQRCSESSNREEAAARLVDVSKLSGEQVTVAIESELAGFPSALVPSRLATSAEPRILVVGRWRDSSGNAPNFAASVRAVEAHQPVRWKRYVLSHPCHPDLTVPPAMLADVPTFGQGTLVLVPDDFEESATGLTDHLLSVLEMFVLNRRGTLPQTIAPSEAGRVVMLDLRTVEFPHQFAYRLVRDRNVEVSMSRALDIATAESSSVETRVVEDAEKRLSRLAVCPEHLSVTGADLYPDRNPSSVYPTGLSCGLFDSGSRIEKRLPQTWRRSSLEGVLATAAETFERDLKEEKIDLVDSLMADVSTDAPSGVYAFWQHDIKSSDLSPSFWYPARNGLRRALQLIEERLDEQRQSKRSALGVRVVLERTVTELANRFGSTLGQLRETLKRKTSVGFLLFFGFTIWIVLSAILNPTLLPFVSGFPRALGTRLVDTVAGVIARVVPGFSARTIVFQGQRASLTWADVISLSVSAIPALVIPLIVLLRDRRIVKRHLDQTSGEYEAVQDAFTDQCDQIVKHRLARWRNQNLEQLQRIYAGYYKHFASIGRGLHRGLSRVRSAMEQHLGVTPDRVSGLYRFSEWPGSARRTVCFDPGVVVSRPGTLDLHDELDRSTTVDQAYFDFAFGNMLTGRPSDPSIGAHLADWFEDHVQDADTSDRHGITGAILARAVENRDLLDVIAEATQDHIRRGEVRLGRWRKQLYGVDGFGLLLLTPKDATGPLGVPVGSASGRGGRSETLALNLDDQFRRHIIAFARFASVDHLAGCLGIGDDETG